MRITHIFIRAFYLTAMILFAVPAARAAYIISFQQIGPNVVATGSGTLDTTSLTLVNFGSGNAPLVQPNTATVLVGTDSLLYNYSGITGPSSFGAGASHPSDGPGTGTAFGITSGSVLNVPFAYPSGVSDGTSTETWSNQTFSSLGLNPGIYVYTWGTASHADSFTVQVTVPEPASLSLFAITVPMLLRRPPNKEAKGNATPEC
jgi:hypothetical protein